jgi:lipopolysaccharide transport system ATP-binding protein
MSNLAIKVEHLSKMYKLGEINNGTLWRDIQTWMAIKRKKEDPHSKIGENKYSWGKDHFWALKDLSFDVQQGDRLGIIGKNGAGKSTLLKILSRITTPTEGIIKIKGKIASLLEVGTGFHAELTGRENIYINGAILGMKKRRIDELLDSIIDFSGIEQHIDTPVKRYSSGMYVRLAFAVAAHLDSDILIADEVLAVGDADFQKKALGKMQDLSTGDGRTVLFVSHNMMAIQKLCNYGIWVEQGVIKKTSNDISEITSDYLQNNISNIQSSSWKNSGNIQDKYFTPLYMQIEDENGTVVNGDISADKNYKIKLVFEVNEISSSLYIGFLFSLYDGTILFYSTPSDYIKNYIVHTGTNILYCSIPGNLLNINDYYVSLGSQVSNHIITNSQAGNNDLSRVMIKISVTSKSTINPFGYHQSALAPEFIWTE